MKSVIWLVAGAMMLSGCGDGGFKPKALNADLKPMDEAFLMAKDQSNPVQIAAILKTSDTEVSLITANMVMTPTEGCSLAKLQPAQADVTALVFGASKGKAQFKIGDSLQAQTANTQGDCVQESSVRYLADGKIVVKQLIRSKSDPKAEKAEEKIHEMDVVKKEDVVQAMTAWLKDENKLKGVSFSVREQAACKAILEMDCAALAAVAPAAVNPQAGAQDSGKPQVNVLTISPEGKLVATDSLTADQLQAVSEDERCSEAVVSSPSDCLLWLKASYACLSAASSTTRTSCQSEVASTYCDVLESDVEKLHCADMVANPRNIVVEPVNPQPVIQANNGETRATRPQKPVSAPRPTAQPAPQIKAVEACEGKDCGKDLDVDSQGQARELDHIAPLFDACMTESGVKAGAAAEADDKEKVLNCLIRQKVRTIVINYQYRGLKDGGLNWPIGGIFGSEGNYWRLPQVRYGTSPLAYAEDRSDAGFFTERPRPVGAADPKFKMDVVPVGDKLTSEDAELLAEASFRDIEAQAYSAAPNCVNMTAEEMANSVTYGPYLHTEPVEPRDEDIQMFYELDIVRFEFDSDFKETYALWVASNRRDNSLYDDMIEMIDEEHNPDIFDITYADGFDLILNLNPKKVAEGGSFDNLTAYQYGSLEPAVKLKRNFRGGRGYSVESQVQTDEQRLAKVESKKDQAMTDALGGQARAKQIKLCQ